MAGKTIIAILFSLCVALAGVSAAPFTPREALTNGDFEAGEKAPTGWRLGTGITWESENGNRFLRLKVPKPGASVSSSRVIPLEPDWGVLRVSCRVRAHDIVKGPEGWHTGRLAMAFRDSKNERVGPWPNVLNWLGSVDAWREESREYLIPEGATSLILDLALFSVEKGQIDFDDVRVTAVRPRPTLEDIPAPAAANGKPWQLATRTRASVCLNGYWRFRPLGLGDDVPALKPEMLTQPPRIPQSPGWGWLAVPSCWPVNGREGHLPVEPDIWQQKVSWNEVEAAWYERELTVPAAWKGRRVFVAFDMPQTQVALWLDGRSVGTVRWPGGRVEITDAVAPGKSQRLVAFVTALPFDAEKMIAMREDMIFKAKSDIKFRGLCGDVFLESEPTGTRVDAVQLRPSVRRKQLGVHLRVAGASAGEKYTLTVTPLWRGTPETTWTSPATPVAADGTLALAMPWVAKRLWDVDQPNLYDLRLTLRRAGGAIVDERVERFGFREVWLAGRNIMLNGTVVRWRALDFSNHAGNAGSASYVASRETFRRMRSFGFNFAILSNYGVDPGETMAFEDLLRAADDEGFLLSFSLPHPLRSLAGYDSKRGTSPEWQALADYCIQRAGNHPSVLAYAMTHNVLGYSGDQNPAKMDGKYVPNPGTAGPRDFLDKRKVATAAESYAKRMDPTRMLYHHQSGHMGDWHTINIYLCWSPMQERMEWLSHWAREGVKPLFFVEWGVPHVASWGSHRLGPFIWRNNVNSEPWAVEFGAAITGDAAYRLTEAEERHIDRYERVYARGTPFHITEVLGDYWGTAREHNMLEIQSEFTRHIWPAFRTWGITAVLPWDQGLMGRNRPGVPRRTCTWKPDDYCSPGIHPDFLPNSGDIFRCANPQAQEVTSLGKVFQRVNADLLASIAGKPERFTERGHLFRPGESIVKQAIIINDRRVPVKGQYSWTASVGGKNVAAGQGAFTAAPGGRYNAPIRITLPANVAGQGLLRLTATPAGGSPLRDEFRFTVMRVPAPVTEPISLYDPEGHTLRALQRLGVRVRRVTENTPTANLSSLVVGRQALTVSGKAPDIAPILARGGTVLVMEQNEDVLSRRLGFRTNVPSLRHVFPRVPDHPALAGLTGEQLRDWRGQATLIPERFDLPEWESSYPMVDWLGFRNSRPWKWGNQGQVASVVIEKPQGGDFLPLLDGGFDLSYTPLLEARVGAGRMLFCQMDVSGRSEADPAADALLTNLVRYAATAKAPAPSQPVHCLAGEATRKLLAGLGVTLAPAGEMGKGALVVADATTDAARLRAAAQSGARVVVLDGDEADLKALMPEGATVARKTLTHTPPPLPTHAAWRGVSPAEVHFRGRTEITAVTLPSALGQSLPTGTLAAARVGAGEVWHCAVTPLRFDYTAPNKPYLKLTHKRTATLVSRVLANAGAAFETPLVRLWAEPAIADSVLAEGWQGFADAKAALTPEAVSAPDFQATGWAPIRVPGGWESQNAAWADYDGVFWYRLAFDVPAKMAGSSAELSLGAVDDEDWTYVNGRLVGHLGKDNRPEDYWSAPRRYTLAPGTLKPGRNILVVKVRDLRGGGGIMSGPPAVRLPARWLSTYYLDRPEANDDPERYNRW